MLRHPIRPISVQSEPCHSRPAGGWSVLISEPEPRQAHVADCSASPAGHSAAMMRSKTLLSPPPASSPSQPTATCAVPAARSAGHGPTTRSDMLAAFPGRFRWLPRHRTPAVMRGGCLHSVTNGPHSVAPDGNPILSMGPATAPLSGSESATSDGLLSTNRPAKGEKKQPEQSERGRHRILPTFPAAAAATRCPPVE